MGSSHVSADEPALEAYSITKNRPLDNGGTGLWRMPDVALRAGEFVALRGIGDDVALALSLAAGLQQPTGGVLRIAGDDLLDLPQVQRSRWRAQHVGFLFSTPRLLPELSVVDNVAWPLRNLDLCHDRCVESAKQTLNELNIGHLASVSPRELGAFEAHLVALARALVHRPAVIIADGLHHLLSAEEQRQFLHLIARLAKERGIAVLLGTTVEDVSADADRTIDLPTTPGYRSLVPENPPPQQLLHELWAEEVSPQLRPLAPLFGLIKPVLYAALVALVIVFLTFVGLGAARLARTDVAIDVGLLLGQAIDKSADYIARLIRGDLGGYDYQYSFYYWGTRNQVGS